ncbi:hypothetical protein M409DRAFT_23358 [Zasmidium cellare ATCC 36951]|uniref:Uncharacterized protein n=1 Tax=Zasmidium cellare ATCC 36951 TaxID=1080233 RepID=A0A6A6CFZ0_ZASCE|nr:uncharacterized protein M409DRAFT_23358 [Zasmidium cellare ATCC 36951]KAF2166167.1 hypothetical protein M409DRAFT_23358 [Zasmidium cellare ATCC 36951]
MEPVKRSNRLQEKREKKQAEEIRQQRAEEAKRVAQENAEREAAIAEVEQNRRARAAARRSYVAGYRRQRTNIFENTLNNPVYHMGKPYHATAREGRSGMILARNWTPEDLEEYNYQVQRALEGGSKLQSAEVYEGAFTLRKMSAGGNPHRSAPVFGRKDHIVDTVRANGEERTPDSAGEVSSDDLDGDTTELEDSDLEEVSDESASLAGDADPQPIQGEHTAARDVSEPMCTYDQYCVCLDCTLQVHACGSAGAYVRSDRHGESTAVKRARDEEGEGIPLKVRRIDSGTTVAEPSESGTPTAEPPESETLPTAEAPSPFIPARARPFQATDGYHGMRRASSTGGDALLRGEDRLRSQRFTPPQAASPTRPYPDLMWALGNLQGEAWYRAYMFAVRGREPRGVREEVEDQINAEIAGEAQFHRENRLRFR